MKVLFVDDSADDREITVKGLNNIDETLEITEAQSVSAALGKMDSEEFDCILSDYQMPGMDGFQFLHRLRDQGVDTPFIFLTGQGNEDVAASALSEGADAYFTKSIDLAYYHRVATTIRKLVEAHRDKIERQKTAKNLQLSEKKYRLLFEKQIDPVFLVDIDGWCFLDVNDAAVKLYGYSKEEFMALRPEGISDEPDKTVQTIETLRKEGEAEVKLRRHRKKDGTLLLVEVSAGTFELDERTVICSIVRDITEKKKAEEAQAESEKKYRQLYESAPDAIITVLVDPDSQDLRIIDCNSAAIKLFGFEYRESMTGLTPTALFPSHQPNGLKSEEKAQVIIRKALKGEPQYFEWNHKKQDGSEFCSEVMLNRIELEGNTYIEAIIRDVTEKKQFEHDFMLANTTVENSGDAAYWIDSDGNFVYVNEAACRSLGYTKAELLEMTVFDIDPTVSNEQWSARWDSLKEKKSVNLETLHRDKDGNEFPVDITANYIQFDGEEYNCVFARDNSRRKKVEEELRKSNVQLAAANKELEAFSYSVSHDLKAPLRSVRGFSQLLLDNYKDKFDEAGARFLENIMVSAEEMNDLIANMLKLSRVTQRELLLRAVDMSALASQIAQNLTESNPERRVTITIEDGLNAEADEGLLRILLDNLISNAWKFTSQEEEAKITLGARRIKGKVTYFVKDNGVGFVPEQSSQLFIPFQRLHSGKEFEGSGIGLATAKRIVRKHGGTIWAEAKQGEGATIYFTLN